MAGTIAIIGLGQIGLSTAMGLSQSAEFQIIGCDAEKEAENRAETVVSGITIEHNLFSAIKDAGVVFLAVPEDQTAEILDLIGGDIDQRTVILDCCPNKMAAASRARLAMKNPENFLGIWMGINPQYQQESGYEFSAEHADLFRNSVMIIAPEVQTSEAAIKYASDIAGLLGMERTFTDPPELDGFLSASFHLPLLAANGLMHCLKQRSGWDDIRQTAGKPLTQILAPLFEKPDLRGIGSTFLNNRENTISGLDDYIRVLQDLRAMLQEENRASLAQLLNENEQDFHDWRHKIMNRGKRTPGGTVNAGEVLRQSFFGGLLRKKRQR